MTLLRVARVPHSLTHGALLVFRIWIMDNDDTAEPVADPAKGEPAAAGDPSLQTEPEGDAVPCDFAILGKDTMETAQLASLEIEFFQDAHEAGSPPAEKTGEKGEGTYAEEVEAGAALEVFDSDRESKIAEQLSAVLVERYEKDSPFSFVGPVLVYVQKDVQCAVPDVEYRQAYAGCKHVSDMPPHVFSVVETAYRAMRKDGESQSVILTGERGSGKSTLCRSALEYITLNKERASNKSFKVLDADRIIDAFTSAKSAYNNTVGSYGSQLYEVQFDANGVAIGTNITVFNVDKNRLCNHMPGEYTFAVYYMMIAGASEAEKRTLKLEGASKFPYLNLDKTQGVTDFHDYFSEADAQRYRLLKNSMSSLGLGNIDRANILRVLAGILWLGEIKFELHVGGDAVCYSDSGLPQVDVRVKDKEVVDTAAQLLQIDGNRLCQAFYKTVQDHTKRRTQRAQDEGRGQDESDLIGVATTARDDVAKSLHSRLVSWLVERANAVLSQDDAVSSICVMDVGAFEKKEGGGASFGALCRNYANDCIQNLFNKMYYETEVGLYNREGVVLPFRAENMNDTGCVSLFEKPQGLLSVLEQECHQEQEDDSALLQHLNLQFHHDSAYKRCYARKGFEVRHSGGLVHYTAHHLLNFNRDVVPPRLGWTMAESSSSLVGELFSRLDQHEPGARITLCNYYVITM